MRVTALLLGTVPTINYDRYPNFAEMTGWLESFAAEFPRPRPAELDRLVVGGTRSLAA